MTKRTIRNIAASAALATALLSGHQLSAEPDQKGEKSMEKVSGIGGLFFRADDTKAVAAWYRDNLGITPVPADYETDPWQQDAGPTVFAPFSRETEYFGNPEQQWMVNFRVNDLDAMVAQLRKNGNEVKVDPETYPNGRFARTHDPVGTPIELWEPAKPETEE